MFRCIAPLPFDHAAFDESKASESGLSRWDDPVRAGWHHDHVPKRPERSSTTLLQAGDAPSTALTGSVLGGTLDNFRRMRCVDGLNASSDSVEMSPRPPQRKLSALSSDQQPKQPIRMTSNHTSSSLSPYNCPSIKSGVTSRRRSLQRTISVVVPSSMRWSHRGARSARSLSCRSN